MRPPKLLRIESLHQVKLDSIFPVLFRLPLFPWSWVCRSSNGMRLFYVHCHLFKVIMELIVMFTIDGRKLCTGSRDNWMCLWDIESAKCEHRRNISRNLVCLLVYFFTLLCTFPCTLTF